MSYEPLPQGWGLLMEDQRGDIHFVPIEGRQTRKRLFGAPEPHIVLARSASEALFGPLTMVSEYVFTVHISQVEEIVGKITRERETSVN